MAGYTERPPVGLCCDSVYNWDVICANNSIGMQNASAKRIDRRKLVSSLAQAISESESSCDSTTADYPNCPGGDVHTEQDGHANHITFLKQLLLPNSLCNNIELLVPITVRLKHKACLTNQSPFSTEAFDNSREKHGMPCHHLTCSVSSRCLALSTGLFCIRLGQIMGCVLQIVRQSFVIRVSDLHEGRFAVSS